MINGSPDKRGLRPRLRPGDRGNPGENVPCRPTIGDMPPTNMPNMSVLFSDMNVDLGNEESDGSGRVIFKPVVGDGESCIMQSSLCPSDMAADSMFLAGDTDAEAVDAGDNREVNSC